MTKLYEDKKVMGHKDIADMLRRTADMIESGKVRYGDKDYMLPDRIETEIEFEKKDGYELEIELSWGVKDA